MVAGHGGKRKLRAKTQNLSHGEKRKVGTKIQSLEKGVINYFLSGQINKVNPLIIQQKNQAILLIMCARASTDNVGLHLQYNTR